MNIDNFVPSELKITASENLNIQNDLDKPQDKSINELINEKNYKNTDEKIHSQETKKQDKP